jgi:hypothetical protein
MRMRPVCVVAAVAVMLAGCGRREGRQTTAVPPRAPGDSLIHAIAPELTEWVAMWRAAIPGFTVDSLSREGGWKWKSGRTSAIEGDPEHRDNAEDLAFDILGIPSPDGRRILDIDDYQDVQVTGESAEAGGEPDSRSVLIDTRARTETEIEFCGTYCGFHWGRWLSPDRFLLGGWQESTDDSEAFHGTMSLYDLRDSTVISYATRTVPRTEYDRYYEAWKGWLLKRYREIQKRPRT